MATRLHRAGVPVTVWNRSPIAALDPAIGVASSARAAVADADIAIVSLADDAAVTAVYGGPEGVAAGAHPGGVVLETSTISPGVARSVGAAVLASGSSFLDIPVSGSVSTVEAGTLTMMAGGDATTIETVRPVLDHLAAKVVHTGDVGTGAATKLAVNALVHALNVAVSEALVLAERAGVDRTVAYDVFASGAAGAPFVQYKRAAFESPDDQPVAFSLDLVAKDLDLIADLADTLGAPMPQSDITRDVVRDAIAAGHGADDMSTVAVHLRNQPPARRTTP